MKGFFMTGEEYLNQRLIEKANFNSSDYAIVHSVIAPIISEWAGENLEEIFPSGSSAKMTALKGKSDVDVFISIKHSCTNTLKEIFDKLAEKMTAKGFTVRKQNVSIGTTIYGRDVDLVPGKKEQGNTNYHWLYKSKSDSRTLTNVKQHITNITNSKRAKFIQLTKIWRNCHRLEFPSMNIELVVLEALKGQPHDIGLEQGFLKVLRYIGDNIETARLVDPCNTNNVISDDMTATEKSKLAKQALWCLRQTLWDNIIW